MNDRDLERVRVVVREELASLGGHLLSTYGGDATPRAQPASPRAIADAVAGNERSRANPQLAALGGYLLEAYGQAPPARGGQVEYQAPARPEVGEPPTTPAPRPEEEA